MAPRSLLEVGSCRGEELSKGLMKIVTTTSALFNRKNKEVRSYRFDPYSPSNRKMYKQRILPPLQSAVFICYVQHNLYNCND